MIDRENMRPAWPGNAPFPGCMVLFPAAENTCFNIQQNRLQQLYDARDDWCTGYPAIAGSSSGQNLVAVENHIKDG